MSDNSWLEKIRNDVRKTFLLLITSIISVILLSILIVAYLMSAKQVQLNWLSSQDWSHFAGAETTGKSVHINPTGRVLNHKDTSTAQPNPPVNVRGSHLKVSGDFQIEISMSGANNVANVQFYTQVPVIYDEWRQERGSIRFEANNKGLTVRIWDGTSSSSIDERIYKKVLKNDIKVVLSHKADKIFVLVNNKTLGYIPDHNIFEKGTIWFGVDANSGTDGWTLKSLLARGIGKGRVELVAAPTGIELHNQTDALRNLSQANTRHLPIGAGVSIYPLFTDEQFRKTVIGQFSMMTPENSLKPQSVHPKKELYTFQDADSLVEVAQKNQLIVIGHALVMAKANPEWMQKTPITDRKQVMTDHINNLVGHFKGKITLWDVVNEPLSEDDIDYTNGRMGLRKQMWFDAMGEGYIDTAFHSARAGDPSAKLYLNDYGIEKDGIRWDALVSLIQRLQARGVPIDGVGFETHIYKEADIINPETLKRHIQVLAGLGIASRISEIDVLGDDPVVQASQYGDVLKICLSEPTCTSYSTWGVTDLYGSTTLSDRYPIKYGCSLLWGTDYSPKPAVTSLQNVLKN